MHHLLRIRDARVLSQSFFTSVEILWDYDELAGPESPPLNALYAYNVQNVLYYISLCSSFHCS
jgi:hypothetical protein